MTSQPYRAAKDTSRSNLLAALKSSTMITFAARSSPSAALVLVLSACGRPDRGAHTPLGDTSRQAAQTFTYLPRRTDRPAAQVRSGGLLSPAVARPSAPSASRSMASLSLLPIIGSRAARKCRVRSPYRCGFG